MSIYVQANFNGESNENGALVSIVDDIVTQNDNFKYLRVIHDNDDIIKILYITFRRDDLNGGLPHKYCVVKRYL